MSDPGELGKRPEEKREFPRIDARIQVQFNTGKEFATCYTQNISRGGIFLETPVLPDPNANVELVLDLSRISPGAAQEFVTIHCRIVRLMTVLEDGKMRNKAALQFVDLPPKVQVLLDKLYQKIS